VLVEAVINVFILLVVVGEGVGMKEWGGLEEWYYMDVRCLVVRSFKGGRKRRGGRESMFDIAGVSLVI
jgi:hypothetical protein